MPRSLVLSNGKFSVTLDKFGFVRDLYYPYVGLENHVMGHPHRIGIMVNGKFTWLNHASWNISIAYKKETQVGYLICKNEELKVSLIMEDSVYNETDVFLRKVDVYNHSGENADVKLFFHQVFQVFESRKRNTAFYDPTHNSVVHFKGKRVFVVNGRTDRGGGIDDYSVGAYQSPGKEGTYKDAEDGELSKNAVEHGNVDSVVRFCTSCEGQSKARIFYWICAGKSLDDAYKVNEMVMQKTPAAMLHSTQEFWRAWLNEKDLDLEYLSEGQKKMFHTSLFILRAHSDNRGATIASADGAMIEYGKDDYSYMWPRDAAFIVTALDRAGYDEVTKPFFEFCLNVLHPDGYLHHRFRADGSLGSTWHSATAQREWLKDKKLQLPIQEDETASVVVALWKHYEETRDIEFIEKLYKPFIEKTADFLVAFRNQDTGLPLPSYDLWEEKIGISTYTCASVYGGLMAASRFSELLGKRDRMRGYAQAAKKIKEAALKYLYNHELKSFVRRVYWEGDEIKQDTTIDSSSLFGIWYFDMLDENDPLFQSTQTQIKARLKNDTQVGGFIRYENDAYFRSGDKSNPWIITTLWLNWMDLRKTEVSDQDLENASQALDWAISHQYPSGVMPEQLHSNTGESLSATPLAWSHAVYIELAMQYCKRKREKDLPAEKDRPVMHEL
ncbi:MAG: glycoside hydrolase family 15 protein [Patescibacteria group bacterium]